MRYLLDTTVVIPVLAGDQDAIDLLGRITPEGYAVSIVSYLDTYQGVVEAPDHNAAERDFMTCFEEAPVLPITPAVARRCAEVRAMLARQGKNPRRRSFDLVIAATVLESGMTLVTHNVRDFADIPGLELRHP